MIDANCCYKQRQTISLNETLGNTLITNGNSWDQRLSKTSKLQSFYNLIIVYKIRGES